MAPCLEYEAQFCHPAGVDAQFLSFFGLKKGACLSASRGNDDEVGSWFGYRATSINHFGMEFSCGESGDGLGSQWQNACLFPFPRCYKHLDPSKITSVFEALEADESQAQGPI